MGLLVVVLPPGVEPRVAPAVADGLADLGVTSLSLARDGEGQAVVLEGWAFDPERMAAAAVALLADQDPPCRTLRPVMHLSIARSDAHGSVRAAEAATGA